MQMEGARTLSSPTTISKPQQQNSIEVTREIILPKDIYSNTFTKDWTGFKLVHTPVLMGFGTSLSSAYDQGIASLISGSQSIKITHRQSKSEQFVTPGQTIIIPIKSHAGVKRFLFLTPTEVDPTGSPVRVE